MTENKSFLDRQRDAALDEQHRIGTRDRHVAELVRNGSLYIRVGEIVAIEDGDGLTTGAFVAEVTLRNSTGQEVLWQVVNDGKRLPQGWHTRAVAILHLLSVRYGDGDPMGTSAGYAARVLGIKDEN